MGLAEPDAKEPQWWAAGLPGLLALSYVSLRLCSYLQLSISGLFYEWVHEIESLREEGGRRKGRKEGTEERKFGSNHVHTI